MNRRGFLTALGAAATVQQWDRLNVDTVDTAPTADTVDAEIAPTRYPYLQNVQTDRATIMWAALESGLGALQYTADGVTFKSVAARSKTFNLVDTGLPVAFTQYQATVTGLTPDTNYSYRAFISGAPVLPGGDLRFKTSGSGNFNFFVLGDSGVGDSGLGSKENQFKIAQRMLIEKPSMVMHLGDVVYPQGTQENYGRNYFNYYYATMSSVPIFPAPGNHDYEVSSAASYLAIHSVPGDNVPQAERGRYYSYDWSNVHFVSLDSNLSLERAVTSNGQMLKWLDNDLESTRQFWRVVYFHHPPYATGSNQNDIQSFWIRQYIVPIFEEHGVQVVFSGHEHSYQRSRPIRKAAAVSADTGTTYFVSGGGGAYLYGFNANPLGAFTESVHHYLRVEVKGSQMTVNAIRHDGTKIESVTLSPKPAFSDDPAVKPVSFEPAPTTGALVHISGRSLSTTEATLCSATLPLDLSGTSVSINGRAIPLVYVSNTQIYAQLPFTIEGNVTVRVTTANGSVEISA